MLKLADIDQAEFIINTASESDLGFNLRKIKEIEMPMREKPVMVTTVEDSATFSFLERDNSGPIFPIHAGHTELVDR